MASAAPEVSSEAALALFGAGTRLWFERAFRQPTAVQTEGWPRIAAGHHTLLLAPTGSGKTLAAFLWCLDQLTRTQVKERDGGVRVLYVSPLKALAYDVQRNLRGPLVGIQQAAAELGEEIVPPRVWIRSGDTSQKERRIWAREPSEILVTTPESLYLILGSQAREALRTVDTVIVDEVHALAPTKRGAHLALSLERLAALSGRDPQRIGLSATATPVADVARYLGGDRPVAIVDSSAPPLIDLKVVVPVPDMTRPEVRKPASAVVGEPEASVVETEPEEVTKQHGIWPVVIPELLALIRAHRTTIVFVNSRGLCERLVQRLCELADEPLVRAHHGSLAQGQRREAEELLKTGRIAGIVATSSLELGIDMGAVDLVIMVESPGAVARGLQRAGRAGHGVGEVSNCRIFPKHRGDLLEATVVARRMRRGELEPLRLPRNPLDVLAQQVVAMCSLDTVPVQEVERVVRRAANFAQIPRDAFHGVLDMLSGRYPSTDFAELRPRLIWDRQADTLAPRRGARMLAILSGGTIPDRGLYAVHIAGDGPRVGELDEEMVHETQPGSVITLGASSWRVQEITRDRVFVTPAPGEVGTMPFWRGEGPGRPIELGRAMGAFLRELHAHRDGQGWLEREHHLDPLAAENLLRYVREQHGATGALPTDKAITIERFRDELGDWRICILTPFGARVHAPWALALEAMLTRDTGYEVQTMYSDDGICLRLADADELPSVDAMIPDPDEVQELLVTQLGHSAMFASHFRENAARALLLPRRRPGQRTPLWQQRLRSAQLLAVARAFPSFPIVVESYRECLQDVFDMPALVSLLTAIRSRDVRIDVADTHTPSPFARSLVFAYVATYLYDGDAPLAERRAQALALDRNMLRELLGQEELRELLDPEIIAELERELQQLTDDRKAHHADGVHHMLLRLGALSPKELRARVRDDIDVDEIIDELSSSRRVLRMSIAGVDSLLAVEDANLYRDGVGAVPPFGVPRAFLEPVERPIEALARRWARTHGPFHLEGFARRHGLPVAAVTPLFAMLEGAGSLVRGAFLPAGQQVEWCDAEVLRRIKRRTLARLRGEVEPVDRATFARFLPAWHGINARGKGLTRLEEALVQLEGMPLSYAELERSVLPARVRDFHPRMLDELGAMGSLVWIGCGALGTSDGKVALYRRDRVRKLVAPPEPDESLSNIAQALLEHLRSRGASFGTEMEAAVKADETLGSVRHDDVVEALWDLVWAGLVTNDTLQPLRALGMRRSGSGRRKGRGADLRMAGRWSLVAQLIHDPASPTERAHARAVMLLERHGLVSREAVELESLPGGFSAVYPVFRSMEEAGKLRRGYFVEGIGGAQFAFPGAVDRLRGFTQPASEPQVTVLSAADPANPYGWIMPWPERPATSARVPKRNAGALLVLVDGEPTLYLERGGHALLTFEGQAREALERGLETLRERLARHTKKSLRIEEIDGEPALRSPLAPLFKELGITFDHRGFIVEREV